MKTTPFENTANFANSLAYSLFVDEALSEYERVSDLYEQGVILKTEYDMIVNTLIVTLQCINPNEQIEA